MDFIIVTDQRDTDFEMILEIVFRTGLKLRKNFNLQRNVYDELKSSFSINIGDFLPESDEISLNYMINDPFSLLVRNPDSDHYTLALDKKYERFRVMTGKCRDELLLYEFCLHYLQLQPQHVISINGNYRNEIDFNKMALITYNDNWLKDL